MVFKEKLYFPAEFPLEVTSAQHQIRLSQPCKILPTHAQKTTIRSKQNCSTSLDETFNFLNFINRNVNALLLFLSLFH